MSYKRTPETHAWMRVPWTCPTCGRTLTVGGRPPHRKHCGHDPAERFWSFVERGEGCWPWTGAKHRDGYGRANVVRHGKSRIRIAHRMAWEFTFGQIPTDKDVCHSCDNRICCNPDHLYLGTHQENMSDMQRKGRAGARGEKCIHAKLTEVQALEILTVKLVGRKKTSARRRLVESLCLKYGVTDGVIYAIWRRHSWAHLSPHDIGEKS